MPNTFLTADPHWGHEKTCTTFKREDGTPLRPFASAEEMDEVMVERWNAVVRPQDKVYVLGDVAMRRHSLAILRRLNGIRNSTLIAGNHDIFPTTDYLRYFKEVRAFRKLDDIVLTHIPIHPQQMSERYGTNVHGHLHYREVAHPDMAAGDWFRPDPRYLCVSVEHTDFTPISLDAVRERILERRKLFA